MSQEMNIILDLDRFTAVISCIDTIVPIVGQDVVAINYMQWSTRLTFDSIYVGMLSL